MAKSRKSKPAKGSKPFSCHHCERSFPQEKSLEQHSRDLHQGLPIAYKARPTELPPKNFRYSCRSCSRTFATADGLRNHFQAAHPRVETTSTDPPEIRLSKPPHDCLNCFKCFEIEKDLWNHRCDLHDVHLDSTGKGIVGTDDAVEAYQNMMAMGFSITFTPATDFLCGLGALAISLRAVRQLYGHKRSPSVEDLKSTLYSKEYALLISDHLSINPELDSPNNLTYDQLSVILQIKSIELGVDYRLGVTQGDDQKTTLILLGEEGQVVWIQNSGGQYDERGADQGMGHWSGYSNLSEQLPELSLEELHKPREDLNETLDESDGSLEERDESLEEWDGSLEKVN